jgi:hypothetical protein
MSIFCQKLRQGMFAVSSKVSLSTAIYADDLVLWCTDEYAATANYRMQIALDNVVTWPEQWCVTVTINREKKQLELSSHSLPKSNLAD